MELFNKLKSWLTQEKDHLSGCDELKCVDCVYNQQCSSGEQNYKVLIDNALLKIDEMTQEISCETCAEKNRCMIYDNFQIKFCADWHMK